MQTASRTIASAVTNGNERTDQNASETLSASCRDFRRRVLVCDSDSASALIEGAGNAHSVNSRQPPPAVKPSSGGSRGAPVCGWATRWHGRSARIRIKVVDDNGSPVAQLPRQEYATAARSSVITPLSEPTVVSWGVAPMEGATSCYEWTRAWRRSI